MRNILFLSLTMAHVAPTAQDMPDGLKSATYRTAYAAYEGQAYDHLSTSNDGLALVLASLVARSRDRSVPAEDMQPALDSPEQRDQLIRRARSIAGDDALVWWSLVGRLPRVRNCLRSRVRIGEVARDRTGKRACVAERPAEEQ